MMLKPIIIFATIFFNGQVENLQYKGAREGFDTEKACYEYMEKYGKHVISTLETHLNNVYPNSRLLVLGCSDRINFVSDDETV